MIHASKFSNSKARTQTKKSNWRAFSVLVLVAIVAVGLLVGVGFTAVKLWLPYQNLPNQKPFYKNLNDNERTNLLLASLEDNKIGSIYLVSLQKGGTTSLIQVDPNLYTPLAGSRGFNSLENAWEIGNLEGDKGLAVLSATVSQMLGVELDGYIFSDHTTWADQGLGNSSKQMLQALTSPLLPLTLFLHPHHGIYTDLNNMRLIKLADRVPKDGRINELTLDAVSIPTTSGKQSVNTVDSSSLDEKVGPLFQEVSIVRTHPRVGVVNASGIPGLATLIARYVRNLGATPIIIETAPSLSQKSQVLDHLGGNSLSARIGALLNASVRSDSIQARADIEIVVGQDAASIF